MVRLVTFKKGIRATLLAFLSAAAAAAEEGALAPADTTAEASRTAGLQEVIVTAQKRSESINKVAMSITALSGDTLREQNIRTVQDLAQVVPGLTYAASLLDTPVYSIRGVGFYETTLAAYPDVSIYVDQVPLPLPVLAGNVGLDLERVEVLKGPQGILFGQNSTGGAINYIAAKPTDKLEAGADLGIGRFNDATFSAFLSGPLSDTLGARLSFQSEQSGPWQHTYHANPGATNGAISKYAGRLLLDWKPLDTLRFELNLNGGVDQSQPIAPQLIGVSLQSPDSPINGPILLNYPHAPDDARAADFTLRNKPRSNNSQYQLSLRGDYSPVEDLTLTSITAGVHYDRDEAVEFGGVSIDGPVGPDLGDEELTQDFATISSFFQELRIANSNSDSVRWLAGVNFDHTRVYEFNLYDYSGSSEANSPGTKAFVGVNLTNTPFYSTQTMNNYAGFGNVDWDITPKVTLAAGARYTQADRKADICTAGVAGGGSDEAFYNLMVAFHPGVAIAPLTPADCVTLDPTTLYSLRQGYFSTLNEHNVSWHGGVNYRPTSNLLAYVNVTKGYKAGSLPMLSAETTVQYIPVKQESVLDYEGGFKLSLLDHAVQLNGAGFHYDYTNKQIRTQLLQPIFGILNNLQNVPKSTVDGGELEIAWQPTSGLRLSAAATYLNAQIVEFVGTNAGGIRADYAGSKVPYSPKFSSNASAEYNWGISDAYIATVGGTLTQRSVSYATIGPQPIDRIDAYVLLDLRAAISTQSGKYRVELWGKNVTNKFYWNNVSHPYDTVVRYAGMPATYGLSLSARF
jgi:iron complex outermembrane recepter protein